MVGKFRANSSEEFIAQLQCEYVSCLRFVIVLAAWFIHTQHVQVALLIALSPLQNSCQKSIHNCVDVQLFLLLEAEDGHSLASEELSLAILSWLSMHEVSTAHAAWQRHSKLTVRMSQSEQQNVFEAA